MKRTLFLYNRHSGRGRVVPLVDKICAVLSSGGGSVSAEAIDFGKNPFETRSDVDMVVVAGGDGTINYVINCMKRLSLDVKIGIIPSGTANDFAKALGMSHNPLRAAAQIISGSVKRIDCGVVNGAYWINVFSFGMFTTTSQHTPQLLKRIFGRVAYMVEGVRELWHRQPIPLHFETEDYGFDVDALMVLIFNGRSAGGFRLARRSNFEDGMFDCVILPDDRFFSLCITMLRYMFGGSPQSVRQIRASHLKITSACSVPTDMDGERGADFPLQIDNIAAGVQVVTPVK